MSAGCKGILYSALAVSLIGAVGCEGAKRGAVSGQVALDGQNEADFKLTSRGE